MKSSLRGIRHMSMPEKFPFESISDASAKLKRAPIEFTWNSPNQNSVSPCTKQRNASKAEEQRGQASKVVGHGGQPRWFHPPPKVRLVPGIVGSSPLEGTRGVYPIGNSTGECIGGGDPETGHHSSESHGSGDQERLPSDPDPFSNLRRFVGHLWASPNPRSFATALKATPAPTVVVKMQQRGQGRRGPWRDLDKRERRGGYGGSQHGRNDCRDAQDWRGGGGDHPRDNTGPRGHVWQRKATPQRQEYPALEQEEEKEVQKGEASGDARWEAREEKKNEADEAWNSRPAVKHAPQPQDMPNPAHGKQNFEVTHDAAHGGPCEIFGFNNHTTRDYRRMFYEICSCNTHTIYDYGACLAWNFGPELCAAQVEGQSFFHIDEIIDTKIARERASTALITMTKGNVSAKDIELLFMNLLGADKWKWIARPTSDKTFVMRFPTAKMMLEWSHIKYMIMKGGKLIL